METIALCVTQYLIANKEAMTDVVMCVLALLSVSATVESINQLVMGRGNVIKAVAGSVGVFLTVIALASLCIFLQFDASIAFLAMLFGFVPFYLCQFAIAQRILKKPIADIITRFSSTYVKPQKAKKEKAKKVKLELEEFVDTDGIRKLRDAKGNVYHV